MATKAYELESDKEEKKKVLFSYEEAIGFMCNTQVFDKDGISAAINAAEMITYLKKIKDMDLHEKLENLYKTWVI